jgi:hypothetical protein
MAVYHIAGVNPRVLDVPDAFLSIGVERKREANRAEAMWSGKKQELCRC